MSHNVYGVVVDQSFTTWLLFSGSDGYLTSVDQNACEGPLHIGDIVQAGWEGNKMRISRCPPIPDHVWTDGRRVIIRTIVYCSNEDTMRHGKWKDETGRSTGLLLSRDIGIVAASTDWYNREFCQAQEYNVFAYVEFVPLSLTLTETGEKANHYWRVLEDRVSLPATLPLIEDPGKFSQPLSLRNVPVLTLIRHGNAMLVWSYALGDHLAFLNAGERAVPGQWMEVTVNRSSPRDFASHGCTYTVVRHVTVKQYSYPEVTVSPTNKAMQMTLNLNRNEFASDNPNAEVKVWHDVWGLPVDYDLGLATWMRKQEEQFRAIVQIGLSAEHSDGRRALIRVVAPANIPKLGKGPAPPPHLRSAPFEDIDELKKALGEADNATKNSDPSHLRSTPFEDVHELKKALHDEEKAKKSDHEGRDMSGDWKNASERGANVGGIRIRTNDDEQTEREWREELREQGWEWPDERDDYDAEDPTGSGRLRSRPNTIIYVPEQERIKVMQCLITRVRFDLAWKEADMIELFVLDNVPAFIVHKMGDNEDKNCSRLRNDPRFTTVGNVVELRVGRNYTQWFTCDEAWRLVMKIPLPTREVAFENGRVKSLELMVTARCLCPEAQDRHNDRHRYDNKGFVMLQDGILHNIVYYGRDIDARDHKDFNFQMVVVPKECLEGHAFWVATVLWWRIPRGDGIPKPKPPLIVPAMVRETTIHEIFAIYAKLKQNTDLMAALFNQTGIDFKKKFTWSMDVWGRNNPAILQNRHKREIECNENLLFTIVENRYSEGIFRKQDEKDLWKLLLTTVETMREWRRCANNR